MNLSSIIQTLGIVVSLLSASLTMGAEERRINDTIPEASNSSLLMYPAGSPRLRPVSSLATENLEREMPPQWQYCEHVLQELPAEDKWWKQFDDPILNRLIILAEKNNFDLRAAYQRIAAAKAQLTHTRSAWFPTLGVHAGWSHVRSSGDTNVLPDVPSTRLHDPWA